MSFACLVKRFSKHMEWSFQVVCREEKDIAECLTSKSRVLPFRRKVTHSSRIEYVKSLQSSEI